MARTSNLAVGAPRRRHVVGPLVLLGVGALLLLNNFGIVPWSIWRTLWPFWPVLVILLGLEALVTGRVSWGGLLLVLLLVAVGSLAVGTLTTLGTWSGAEAPIGSPTSQFRHDLGGATRAIVRVRYGAGALRIGSLADGGTLAEGERYGRGSATLETRYQVREGVGELVIQPRGERRGFPRFDGEPDRLDLRLSRAVPLELRVDAGAADALLDLRDLRIADLRVETGASRGTIILPATGQTNATIRGGAAALTIEIPPEVAARIVLDNGLSDVRIDEGRFPRQGREYRSPNYDTAPNRVDLTLSVGAARVDVQ